MTRDLIDTAAWALIAPFLPPERGRACRPSLDNRRVLEGIVWIARTGSPWRDLLERFGKWNTVWRWIPVGATPGYSKAFLKLWWPAALAMAQSR